MEYSCKSFKDELKLNNFGLLRYHDRQTCVLMFLKMGSQVILGEHSLHVSVSNGFSNIISRL